MSDPCPAAQNAELSDDERFSYNAAFESKMMKLKVNALQAKESSEEKAATDEAVVQGRTQEIDAALVRIMKARKRLAHSELLAEVFQQLRFQPQVGRCCPVAR